MSRRVGTPDLSGLWVPLITPFTADDDVDTSALRRLAGEVLDDGATGLVALGTTGEPTSLSAGERDTVVGVCTEVAADRGAGLIVGAGTNDTRTTLDRHRALADVPGVTASLAVVPYYVRPSEAAVVEHLRYVADRSPVPVVVYNVPVRTGRGLGAAALLDLAAVPNIVGVKQAVAGVDLDTVALLAAAGPDFAVLAGEDPFLPAMMLLGARGGITASAHVATARFAALVSAGLAGHAESTRARGAALLPLITALFAEPNPAVIKAVLHAEGRIATPAVRMPLASATDTAVERACRAAETACRNPVGAPAARPLPSRVVLDPDPLPLADAELTEAGADDAAELLVLQRCCWVSEAILNDTLDIPPLHEDLATVRGWVVAQHVWLVRRGGRLVGAVRARRVGDRWEIGRLMVAPDLAGHGLGRWLLGHVEREAPAGVTAFHLFTGAASDRNLRMYRRAGYEVSEPGPEDAVGHIRGAVHLAKPVRS